MTRFFYAVMSEPAGWYSTAVRARDIASARAILARRYPYATIVSIER